MDWFGSMWSVNLLGERITKIGIVIGVVLLILNLFAYYSTVTGVVTLFSTPAGRLMAYVTVGVILLGLTLYLFPEKEKREGV